MGFRIPRGVFRGIEEGTYFAGYPVFGYWHINVILAVDVLRRSALFLEDQGYEGVPVPNIYLGPSIWTETGEKRENVADSDLGIRKDIYSGKITAFRSVSPDKPMPDVTPHFRLAAVAAGLGELGVSKLFMSPEFGPRQRLALLLTDAPLEPDPLYQGEVCDRCMLCVGDCPGALSRDEVVEVNIGGKVVSWHELDVKICRLAYAGGNPESSPFVPRDYDWREKAKGDSIGAAFEIPYNASCMDKFHHLGAMEGAPCMRTCMDHLEKEGRIKARFQNDFRKRRPWRLEYDIK
jgi:hypothetical protein